MDEMGGGGGTRIVQRELTRRAVIVLIVLAPQFCMSVLGMTSRDLATALYGHCSTPVIDFAFSFRA